MLICNKCGKTGKRGKFCVYCGGELSEFFTLKTAETKAEPTGRCPECGKEFSEGKFCVYCGTTLQPIGTAAVVEEVNSPVAETTVEAAPAPAAETIVEEITAPVVDTVVEETPAPVVDTVAAQPAEAVKLKCTSCGKLNDRGKFCTACGGHLVPVTEADTPTTTAQPEAAVKLQCSECGKIHDKGKFCTVCGGSLVPMTAAPSAEKNEPAATPVSPYIPVQINAPSIEPAASDTPSAAPVGLKCSKCGKQFEKGRFCTVCGGDLIPDTPAAPTQHIAGAVAPSPVVPQPVNNTAAKLRCTECGKIMDKGKFCTNCGGNLVPMDSAAEQPSAIPQPVITPVTPPPAAQTGSLVCPSCGKSFEKGKFCTVCGTTLVPQQSQPSAPANDGLLHCMQCGKTFEKGKFCTVCGGKLVTSDALNV